MCGLPSLPSLHPGTTSVKQANKGARTFTGDLHSSQKPLCPLSGFQDYLESPLCLSKPYRIIAGALSYGTKPACLCTADMRGGGLGPVCVLE